MGNIAANVVILFCGPIANSGHNETCENWVTLIPLETDLPRNNILTFVGTTRENKGYILQILLAIKGRLSCRINFEMECLLVSNVTKQNKNVLLINIHIVRR